MLLALGRIGGQSDVQTGADKAEKTSCLSEHLQTGLVEVGDHLGGTVKLRNRFSIEFELEVEKIHNHSRVGPAFAD